jgi:hypothetical protein
LRLLLNFIRRVKGMTCLQIAPYKMAPMWRRRGRRCV